MFTGDSKGVSDSTVLDKLNKTDYTSNKLTATECEMAIMYNKGTDYSILKSLGVPNDQLQILKFSCVILSVGTDIIRLEKGQYKLELSFGSLGVGNAVKNPKATIKVGTLDGGVSFLPADLAVANFVSTFISEIVNTASSIDNLGVLVPDSPSSFISKPKKIHYDPNTNITTDSVGAKTLGELLKEKLTTIPEVTLEDNYASLPVVKLRDATVLYQRVEGTDPSSVYRLVAANDKVKMAVRVKHGVTLSIRLEGTISDTVANKLIGYGLSKKNSGHYSGHFDCKQCTPENFIGALIVGSGIRFTTPIPDYSKVSK